MRHLKLVSYLMTLLGVALIAGSVLFDVSSAVTLVGLLLVVAGGVKIVMVLLWSTVGGMTAASVPVATASDEHRGANGAGGRS